ncbi:MAG: hypothetical protein ACP5NW_05210 [Candidatus Woesearchaeota archaeon]
MALDLSQEEIELYNLWDKIYPERFAPGETPEDTRIRLTEDEYVETPIQCRIRNMITYGKRFSDYVDARWNPYIIPKKYYSDGFPVDWHNLEKSNQEYNDRSDKHEFGLPGIENLLLIYTRGLN